MDDLIQYLITMFRNDPILLTYYEGAGQSKVIVRFPQQRIDADYPQILVYSMQEGRQIPYGENFRPKFFRGAVKIEIAARQSDSNPDPLNTLDLIKKRILYLILGDPFSTPVVQGIQGKQVSSQYRIDSFYQIAPTGYIESEDNTMEKWVGTYECLINQIGSPTFP